MAASRLVSCVLLLVLFTGCVLEPYATPSVARMQQAELEPPVRPAKLSVLGATSRQFPEAADGQVAARIRAIVNTTPILEEEVREACARHLVDIQAAPESERATRYKEVVRRELQQLVERELILQEMMTKVGTKGREKILESIKSAAGKEFDKKVQVMKRAVKDKLNITSDEDFRSLLRAQGMSLEGMRRQNERDFLATAYIRSRIDQALERVGHEEVREYYQAHPQEFQVPDKVQWQSLFVDASRFRDRGEARRFADQLITQARSGADFQKLAMQYDQGDSRYRNGEGYGQKKGEIQPPEAEGPLFQMRDGDLALLEMTNGFHIFKLVKRDYAGLMPLDDKLQTTIRGKLKNDVWDREYKRIVAQLKQRATIELLEE
jgi:peptidyl-prolyl cis-trans isomerase SurA